MSSSSDDCACSSGPISSSISRSAGVNEIDDLSLMSIVIQAWHSTEAAIFEELGEDPKAPEAPEAPDGHSSGGG
nr:hypothetical protein [Tanacetum cinerariifolium]